MSAESSRVPAPGVMGVLAPRPVGLVVRACPDCPATHARVLQPFLPHATHACAFRVVTVAARETIPYAWFGTYALGLVRRGLIVRQRVDGSGRVTSIDAVGPGSVLMMDGAEGNVSGYAATETMVCLCPQGALEAAACTSLPTMKDLLRLQAMALERMDRIADARNRNDALARVAALLCALADVLSPPRRLDVIPPHVQRRDFAGLLALRHESVCRALSKLETMGAVRRTPDGIVLVDRPALEAA